MMMRNEHTLAAQAVLLKVGATVAGLTDAEAARRLAVQGANCLTPPQRHSAWMRFLLQFHNVLIYVLLASATVTAVLGHWVDSSVIFGVVVINAYIGFVQEGKAEQAMEAIRKLLSRQATVLRAGQRLSIAAESLVVGDVVLLQSGDSVPADLRLLTVKNLRIEEAALTGESLAVEKSVEPVPENAALGDRHCMAYSSTLVVYGQGTGVVVRTADQTEIGQINTLLNTVQPLTTPLLRQMEGFARWLTVVILGLAAVSFVLGWQVHHIPLGELFLAAVSMAVAAIPEGLPAILTITLALGVQRMAKRNAITRRLPAVEALGAVTVICTDKTGTLTCNEMTVRRVMTRDAVLEVSGEGYAPQGGFTLAGHVAPVMPEELCRVALLCNDAVLHKSPSGWQMTGDPTEGALVTLARKAGLDVTFEQQSLPRMDVIPFESAHRFMATLHHDHTRHACIFVKGATEAVLAMCAQQRHQDQDEPLDWAAWHAKQAEAGALGQRVLALAMKVVPHTQRELTFHDMQTGFTLLGMVGITDPPRATAVAAVGDCQRAGICVKMITGDHADTARAIAAQVGIGERVLTGSALDEMDDAQLRQAVQDTDVFARASPEHKLRLVAALQANGDIVAMTGDGVNDAPALKRADIGVAMGLKGTEVAKEAAEMVLADDNFATIVHAVEEGRTVYDNLRKAIVFTIPTNGGEAGMVLIALLFGITLPITPVQILWVNMVTAVTLALALSFEPAEAGVMRRPPRAPKQPLLSGFVIWRVIFVSLLLTVGPFALFLWENFNGAPLAESRTVAINALVVGQMAYLFNCRYLLAPVITWQDFTANRAILISISMLIVIQLLFTYLPWSHTLFGVVPLDLTAWGHILTFGILLFSIVELEKWLIGRGQSVGVVFMAQAVK